VVKGERSESAGHELASALDDRFGDHTLQLGGGRDPNYREGRA
jgi:hypothetical protein